MSKPVRNRIAFFGHDRLEPTIRKRLSAFQHAGWSVTSFMFVRRREGLADGPASDDLVPLGRSIDRNYGRRLPLLAIGVARALRRWRDLRAADVIYARNLDMALVAWASARIAGSRAPLVYEVLDIQRLMLRQDMIGRLARFVERRLLARSALLVVSSPEFVFRYFEPLQNYRGSWRLLENKILAHLLGDVGRDVRRDREPGPPWVIGWFGTLRCARSLDMLTRIARELDDHVRIVIAGRLSEEDIDPAVFHDRIAAQWNMSFLGPYKNPVDLPRIYDGVHFTWTMDYLDDGSNSDWLLPNRLYEGGLFGSLALAREHTATGRFVDANQLGVSLSEPVDTSVVSFLQKLGRLSYLSTHDAAKTSDLSKFVDDKVIKGILADFLD